MKWNLFFSATLLSLTCFAQKPKITWGDEFKLKKGSTDLEVIYADKNGVFLQEGHLAMKSYFLIGASSRSSATLVKLDRSLVEVYRNDYNSELKGKEFIQFYVLQDKLFVIATDYEKKEKTLTLFGAEVDKNSGNLKGDWVQVTSFQKEEKADMINLKITLNSDSSNMVIVSTIAGKARNEYAIQEFDKNLKASSRPINISNEFDPQTFQLEDVLYTINKKVVLVGRIYEFQEGKKKKSKFLEFSNYNIRLYDDKGKKEKEINTNVNGKWLSSTKLIQEKDKDIVLAAFYSNQRKGKVIDGMLVQRINPVTGEVISTSEKVINHSLLSGDTDEPGDDIDESESKAERREREKLDKIKDEGEAFSKFMQFRNILYTKNGELVIVAEKYHHYIHTTQHFSPGVNGSPGTWTTRSYSVYECGDILMCKIDNAGNIGWMQILPKAQREVIPTGNYYSGFTHSAFFDASSRPFYAGFAVLQVNNEIQLLFNDNPKNAVVTQAGQKVKTTSRFAKSHCYLVSVDASTGKMQRKMFFTNSDIPTSMPRLGSVIGEEMYIVGKEDRFLGKSKVAVAKITMK
ncbi:MAG: hypothetical protein H7Y42_19870 [Chitinophagaceae bacterium]|nr:hypothetical protein [Chitinophagaceae bacterium]